jgi:hypothetical protein
MRNVLVAIILVLYGVAYGQGADKFSCRVIFDVNKGDWIEPIEEFFRANVDIESEQREDGKVLAVKVDLNDDGEPEYFIRTVCGNGGCDYPIFDGRSKRFLGSVFGSVVWLSMDTANGMPIIQSYSHLAALRGVVFRYEFDGTRYKQVSSRELSGEENDSFFEALSRALKTK